MNTSFLRDVLVGAPFVILGMGLVGLLLMDAFYRRKWMPAAWSAGAILLSLLILECSHRDFGAGRTIFGGFVYADPYSLFFGMLVLGGSLLALLPAIKTLRSEGIEDEAQYYQLFIASVLGALLFVQAAEFITLFIGLELMSLSLYCLCGGALRRRSSSEAALKYFVLGSFGSAFLLFGIAIVYAMTGTTLIAGVSDALSGRNLDHVFLFIAFGCMATGLFFKIGLVPFQFWVPDVYQGAPTPVTVFMSTVVKVASLGAALRVLWGSFSEVVVFWQGAVWIVSLLSVLFGNLVALRQRSLKRMLAYSSIAHSGYVMMAFLAPAGLYGGGAAVLYYCVAYLLMTMGAFTVVIIASAPFSLSADPDDISRFNGLGYRQPFFAAMMSLFMLALAGLPPGMAGLLAKFYAFNAAIKAGYVLLPVLGVIGSAISCYYYLRVIVAMYFVENDEQILLPFESLRAVTVLLWVCALGVVLLGVFPATLYEFCASVMELF